MISLKDNGENDSQIIFTPRYIKRKHPELVKQLIYGYFCPRCSNVIQAFFITEKPVDLMIYEETKILQDTTIANSHVDRTVPNKNDNYSCYQSTFFPTTSGSGQMIRLINHTLNWSGHNNRENWLEKGDRPCKMIGWKPINRKTFMKDFTVIYGVAAEMPAGIPAPTPEFVYKWLSVNQTLENTGGVIALNPVGKGLPMILVPRHQLRDDNLNMKMPFALRNDWAEYLNKEKEKQEKLAQKYGGFITEEEGTEEVAIVG